MTEDLKGEGWRGRGKEGGRQILNTLAHSKSAVAQGFRFGIVSDWSITPNHSSILAPSISRQLCCETAVSKKLHDFQNFLFHPRHKDYLRSERDVTTDTTEVQRISDYYEQLHTMTNWTT